MKIAENISRISEPVCQKTQVYIVTIVENKAIHALLPKVNIMKTLVNIRIDGSTIVLYNEW